MDNDHGEKNENLCHGLATLSVILQKKHKYD